MQSLHRSGALRPARSSSARQADDGDHPLRQGIQSRLTKRRIHFAGRVDYIVWRHIGDRGAAGQPILRESDSTTAQLGANLFVLLAIKTKLFEHGSKTLLAAETRSNRR